jgi:hypothetical protein
MRRKILIGGLALIFMAPLITAQEMSITDNDDNVLLQINDEGDAGSLTLPQNTAVPGDSADKLHNVGGVLYWEDAQLGTGWTRTGTDVHLINSGDNVGIGVTDPDAKLEVNGQVKITGGSPGDGKLLTSDADGLAVWETRHQPRAAYAWGDLDFEVTGTGHNYNKAKSVSITVPAAGTILSTASGYVSWESANWDVLLAGIVGNWEGDPNSDWTAEVNWHQNRTIITDYNCTDATEQYTSWSVQRGFTVSSAGTYTISLWVEKWSSSAVVRVGDITMSAEYFPN